MKGNITVIEATSGRYWVELRRGRSNVPGCRGVVFYVAIEKVTGEEFVPTWTSGQHGPNMVAIRALDRECSKTERDRGGNGQL